MSSHLVLTLTSRKSRKTRSFCLGHWFSLFHRTRDIFYTFPFEKSTLEKKAKTFTRQKIQKKQNTRGEVTGSENGRVKYSGTMQMKSMQTVV